MSDLDLCWTCPDFGENRQFKFEKANFCEKLKVRKSRKRVGQPQLLLGGIDRGGVHLPTEIAFFMKF